MKKFMFAMLLTLMLCFTSCTGCGTAKGDAVDSTAVDTVLVDSVDSVDVDTVAVDTFVFAGL